MTVVGRSRSRVVVTLWCAMVVALLATLTWTISGPARLDAVLAQSTLDCGGVVRNGDFEEPHLPNNNTSLRNGADYWGGSYDLYRNPNAAARGVQWIYIQDEFAVLSQTLDTSTLMAGDTLTIWFWHVNSLDVTLGATSLFAGGTSAGYSQSSISTILTDDAQPLVLTFTPPTFGANVDDVTASCTRPDPTNTPTETPTNTPTETPALTATGTTEPTATNTPTEVPAGEVDLTVTGDPRFPLTGTTALDTPVLSYTLLDAPDEGSVLVNPDGSFTYTADNYLVTFDQFAVLATDGTTITVNVVLKIDPSVPSYGEVKPGATGGGGDADDARAPSGPVATVPADDEEGGDGGSCWRCD